MQMDVVEYRQYLRSLGYRQWRMLQSNEIRELPNVMREDEILKKAMYGSYEGGWAMIVATDQRIIFIDRKIFRRKVQYIAYRNIFSFDYSADIFYGQIEIYARGAKITMRRIRRKQLIDFCQYLDQMVEEPHQKK